MSLIVDGLQLHNRAAGYHLDLTVGRFSTPPARVATSSIPFMPGARGELSIADRRPLQIESRVLALPDAEDHQAFVDDLRRRLSPTRTEPVLIRDTLPNGDERFCWAWPRACDIVRIGGRTATPMHAASIALEGLDPFWYSAYGTLDLDEGAVLDDGEILDAGGEIVVAAATTEIVVDAGGSADVARIRVRFEGASGGNVGIENLSVPGVVGFVTDELLVAGDRVTVDNWHRDARRDLGAGLGSIRAGMTLRPGNRHGEYLRLVPGSNTLRILGAPTETRIAFFRTWL